MKPTTYGKIWVYGGLVIFVLSLLIFGRTQNWFDSGYFFAHNFSVYGILATGTLMLIYLMLIGQYVLKTNTRLWYGKLPFINQSIGLHSAEARVIQGISIVFFIVVPLYFHGHFMRKFYTGTAFYLENGEVVEKIVRAEHLKRYVPFMDALNPLPNEKYKYGHLDSHMTYIPFWEPWFLEIYGAAIILSGLLLISFVFVPREKHWLANAIYTRYINRKFVKIFSDQTAQQKQYDYFISHASEDKAHFVSHLVNCLEQDLNKTVWYDQFRIKKGDSLTEAINIGLLASKQGVLVLSKHFFLKEWTKLELEFLIDQQKKGKSKLIPIWLDVDYHEVAQFNEELADIFSIPAQATPDKIKKVAQEIVNSRAISN